MAKPKTQTYTLRRLRSLKDKFTEERLIAAIQFPQLRVVDTSADAFLVYLWMQENKPKLAAKVKAHRVVMKAKVEKKVVKPKGAIKKKEK